MLFCTTDTLKLPETPKTPEGIVSRILLTIMSFFMMLYTILHMTACCITKKLPDTVSDHCQNVTKLTPDETQQAESRPPSPTPPFSQADLLSSVLKRLGELEEKVNMLQAKPSEMPCEKEELLNAAVCRVDALEAELIATKQVPLMLVILSFILQNVVFISVTFQVVRLVVPELEMSDVDTLFIEFVYMAP